MSQKLLTINTLFTDPIWLQFHSDDVVIFCPLLGQCVKVAWPTSNGDRIAPNGLRAWLRRRSLHWPCFCPLETGDTMSCQIVHETNGRVTAHCGQYPSHCGFRMDLSRIHRDTLFVSEYEHIPIQPGEYPDMEKILSIYLKDPALEDLAYVAGYCGEFVGGIYQQAGPRRMPVPASDRFFGNRSNNYDHDQARRRRRDQLDREAAFYRAGDLDAARQSTHQLTTASPAYTRVRRPVQANAIAGPSNQPGNGAPGESEASPTQMETELLTRLANGSGLSQQDSLGFLETCTRCGNLFLGSFLRRHLTSCTHHLT